MKIRTLVFSLITLSFLGSLFAVEPGSNSYGKAILDSLQRSGLVKLNGTSIKEKLQVSGSMIANDADIGFLDIMGDANLSDTVVHQDSTIMGSFQASRSQFEKPITLLSHRALFTACKIDSIIIQKDLACKVKQVIELKQKTIVSGSIHFESGKGEVILAPGSKINGTVTGGKIIQRPH